MVTVNGDSIGLPDGATVGDAIAVVHRDATGRGIAVALNGTVVPRAAWAETPLAAGDAVEVLTAVAGG